MISRTNAGGGLGKSTLVVQTESGSVVTVSKGTETRNAVGGYGVWAFPGLSAGEWTVKAVRDGMTATKTVTMDGTNSVAVSLVYSKIPAFSYSGDYEIVDDADTPITTSDGNWKIRFLTSGVFTPTDLRGAENGIDVFLVGGGSGGKNNKNDYETGSGGGGGKTETVRNFQITANTAYPITIGAGGSPNKNGGQTIAFGSIVDGGVGKHGGSGGGGIGYAGYSDGGGYDGEYDGGDPEGSLYPGTGQGTTTREFGDIGGTLYSAGGGAGDYWNVDEETNRESVKPGDDSAGTGALSETIAATAGKANRGGGGGGGSNKKANAAPGGSGIVIIRNARGVA